MKRKLVMIALIFCIALLLLACASSISAFGIHTMSRKSSVFFAFSEGGILIVTASIQSNESFEYAPDTRFVSYPNRFLRHGSKWYLRGSPYTDNFDSSTLEIPGIFFIPAFAAATFFLLRASLRRKPKKSPLECSNCGYDLRAGHERCPECGQKTSHFVENSKIEDARRA